MSPPTVEHDELTASGFAALLSAAADAIVIIKSDGKIANFNLAAEQLFGYSRQDVLDQNVNMLMPSPYHDQHDQYLQAYLSTGHARIIGIGRRVEGMRKDKTIFPMELSVGEYKDHGFHYFVGIIRDLSQREQAEKALEESTSRLIDLEKRLAHVDRVNIMGEMVSGIAHEINQPLSAISAYIQASLRRLHSGGISAEKFKELLEKTEQQSQRAGEIVRRIRSMIKPQEVIKQRVSIVRLCSEALLLAKADAKSKQVEIRFEYDENGQEVFVDSIQIQQVLLNLVRNAVDATSEQQNNNRTVVVSIQSDAGGKETKISVRDNGPGVSDDIKDNLFDPFVTSKPQGIGLGLSISRTIIENHGGQLWLEPTESGSLLCFYLPTVETD